MQDFIKYQGMKFVDGGRDATGCDCWGLVRLVLKEQLNIDAPSYGEISAKDLMAASRQLTRDAAKGIWTPVQAVETVKYDVCIMSDVSKKVITHVGIMINDSVVMHIEEGVGVLFQKKTEALFKRRIRGFRRHQDANQ